MYYMFYYASSFGMQLCWDTSGATITLMFDGSSGSVLGSCSTMQFKVNAWCNDATRAAVLYGDISSWDTSNVTDMSYLFSYMYCRTFDSFNEDISNWDVSRVTNMGGMFAENAYRRASVFNSDVSSWDGK